MSDAWEKLRHLTLDQLVTQTKLSGSAQVLYGFTTPEGWPFMLVMAVAKPGNEMAVELVRVLYERMVAFGAPMKERAENPQFPPHPAMPPKERT